MGSRRTLSAADTAAGLRMLATLLEAELPVGRALWAFADVAPRSWHSAIPMLQQAIREGHSLGAALAAAPLGLPPVILGLVRAGEAAGGMARAVNRAADLAERDAAMRASIRAALAYPLLLAVVGTGAVALLVAVVIPRFAAVLTELGQVLPPATRAVLAIADTMRSLAFPAIIVAALLWLAWRRWTSSEDGCARWHAFLLSVPVLGSVRLSAACARSCTAAAELLQSGMPLSGALLHAATASGDMAIRRRIVAARALMIQGRRLSQALASERAMPPAAVKLVQTGEESGRLPSMFAQAARVEAGRAEDAARTALRLLEPALLLVFGGIVALVAAALLQAVYGVRPAS